MKKLNKRGLATILANLFVLIVMISMVLTGNNWSSTSVKVLCTSSLFLNVLFIEFLVIKGEGE